MAMHAHIADTIGRTPLVKLNRTAAGLDAATGEDLGLGHLLAADAAGAAKFDLQLRHIDRLVHLAVHAVAHAVSLCVVAHLLDVALERIEIEHQARRLDLGLGHANGGRNVVADLEIAQFRHLVHGLFPFSEAAARPGAAIRYPGATGAPASPVTAPWFVFGPGTWPNAMPRSMPPR